MISTIEKSLSIYRDSPTCPSPNLVNFDPETAENGWRIFANLLIFAFGDTASFTAWTLYNRQQVNFGTCYVMARAYSLEQQMPGGHTPSFAVHLVFNKLLKLKDGIAPGDDGCPTVFVQELAFAISLSSSLIFQESLYEGHTSRQSVINYRFISIYVAS